MSSTAQANVDIKVVLLGREYSGKTSLVQRFVYNRFGDDIPYQPTVGTAYTSKSIKTRSGRSVCIGLWDTAGSERYESLSRLYYRGAWAAVICYDVSDSKSFEKAKFWVEELRKQESNCRVFLSGCKKDLCLSVAANAPRSGSDLTSAAGDGALMKRGTDYYAIADYAQEIGARLYETSSKTGENICKFHSCIVTLFH